MSGLIEPESCGSRGLVDQQEWYQACRGGKRPVDNFDYAGPMTETVLLGVLSLRAPGRRLEWDSENLTVKNAPELNPFIKTVYRKGWSL